MLNGASPETGSVFAGGMSVWHFPYCLQERSLKMEKQNCPACGGPTPTPGQLCPNCDAKQRELFAGPPAHVPIVNTQEAEDKNRWVVTMVLCYMLGWLGIHRLYTGHILIGIVQMLTFGCCMIWWIVDGVMLVTGNFKDADGKTLKP